MKKKLNWQIQFDDIILIKYSLLQTELPKQLPVITGIQPRYRHGDTIHSNCTSFNSKPVANLTWMINDVPVGFSVPFTNEKFISFQGKINVAKLYKCNITYHTIQPVTQFERLSYRTNRSRNNADHWKYYKLSVVTTTMSIG